MRSRRQQHPSRHHAAGQGQTPPGCWRARAGTGTGRPDLHSPALTASGAGPQTHYGNNPGARPGRQRRSGPGPERPGRCHEFGQLTPGQGPYSLPKTISDQAGNLSRVLLAMRTSISINGTSTSTPTTVASAAPDCRPNRAMAAATASSKKLLAPIMAPGAAMQWRTFHSLAQP